MENIGDRMAVRSWLFAPGDSARKMEKAVGGTADIVIFDLEDAVTDAEKPKARAMVAAFMAAQPMASRKRLWVRINPLDGPYALADLAAIVQTAPGGIMLPKSRGRADAELVHHYITALEAASELPIGAIKTMILATETAEGMLATGTYAGVPRIAGMSWGAEDLATALGASDNHGPFGGYGFTYELARSLCLAGAAIAGVPAIETIHGDFRDDEGLRKRAADMRRAGFRGMLAIHPNQVEIINETFSPSAEELAAAQEIADLFTANPGAGTIGHKGAMLDRPHLARALAVLAQAGR
jgi:citrate lyase subunit beta/citryl-CoA lyase